MDIVDAPVISCLKSDVSEVAGNSIVLTCEVRANPRPTWTWQQGDSLDVAQLIDVNTTRATENVC